MINDFKVGSRAAAVHGDARGTVDEPDVSNCALHGQYFDGCLLHRRHNVVWDLDEFLEGRADVEPVAIMALSEPLSEQQSHGGTGEVCVCRRNSPRQNNGL